MCQNIFSMKYCIYREKIRVLQFPNKFTSMAKHMSLVATSNFTYSYHRLALNSSMRLKKKTKNKSPRAQRRSPGYKVQIFNKIFKALSLTVAE